MKIIPLHPNGYDLCLGFNTPENPVHIAASLSDEEFLKYIEKELRKRRFDREKFYTGERFDPLYHPNKCCGA